MVQKSEAKTGIRIHCHGRFYFKTETAKGTKPFEQIVRAQSLEMFRETSQKYLGTDDNGKPQYRINSYLNVRGQLKRRLLPILLSRKFPDFARVRFVVIDEVVSETNEKLNLPIDMRSKAQLIQMIRDEKMPIDPQEYLEIDDLRLDITQYIQEPQAFLEQKPLKDKRRQEEKSFLEMNDLGDETLPPVREKKEKKEKPAEDQKGILDD